MDTFRVRMISKYAGFEAGQIYWIDSWLASSLVNKGYASLATAILDSDSFTRPSDTNAYGAGDEMNSATVQVKQKETITLTGGEGTAIISSTGGLSKTVTYNISLTQTATDFVTDFAADYLVSGITLTSNNADLIFEAAVAGVPFAVPVITPAETSNLAGTVAHTTANVTAIKQKETITLTGTSGTANVTLTGGLTKLVTFAAGGTTDLTQTASDFVASHAAAYLAQGIVLTSSTITLIFEASVAGTPFTAPAITNVTTDLSGSVAHTTANRVAVKQKETITVTGTAGEATIAAAGGLTKVLSFVTDLATTNAGFVTANAADYLAQGIVLTSITGNKLVFEANVAGTGFTAPTIVVINNVTGSVVHTTANVTFGTLTLELNAGKIVRVNLSTTNLAFAGKQVRLWFYGTLPTEHVGDNVALANPGGDFYLDMTFAAAVSGNTSVYAQSTVDLDIGSSTIYVLVQALEAMTPVSAGVFTIELTAN